MAYKILLKIKIVRGGCPDHHGQAKALAPHAHSPTGFMLRCTILDAWGAGQAVEPSSRRAVEPSSWSSRRAVELVEPVK